jgi:hypothetical protein
MKFSKYEENNNTTLTFEEFNKIFNNTRVAFDILLDRRISAWNTA